MYFGNAIIKENEKNKEKEKENDNENEINNIIDVNT